MDYETELTDDHDELDLIKDGTLVKCRTRR